MNPASQCPWLGQYPEGVPASIDVAAFPTLAALLEASFSQFASRAALSYMGREYSYAELERQSRALAAFLQSRGLKKGDRVAVMMPNVPQYAETVAAVLRAGMVVVNVNPLYTPRELEHQLNDSGARALVVMENFADTVQACLPQTQVQNVILASVGERLGWVRGAVVDFVLRHVRKAVPAFRLPGAVRYAKAIAKGRRLPFQAPPVLPDDIAVLQYTGGTTGVPKGAMLLHRNLVANALQAQAWYQPVLKNVPEGQQIIGICALPLYHIFAFTASLILTLRIGGKTVLIPNPRDMKATLRELARHKFHQLPAVNTLFNGMLHHPDFDKVDWPWAAARRCKAPWPSSGFSARARPFARATACLKPRPSPAATPSPCMNTAAPSACPCPIPTCACSMTRAAKCPRAKAAKSPSKARRSWPATGSAPMKPRWP